MYFAYCCTFKTKVGWEGGITFFVIWIYWYPSLYDRLILDLRIS